MGNAPQIRIRSRKQFDWLLDHLAAETCRVGDHWRLWVALDAAIPDYRKEINQTPEFWGLTIRAIQESTILRLTRLFDPTKGALSIHNLLQPIHHHALKLTLALLGLNAPSLCVTEVQEDLKIVAEADPLVCRLMSFRNKYFSHREADLVSCGTFSSLPEFRRGDIEQLLNRASSLVRKYCLLYGRLEPPGQFVEGDVKQMLKLLRWGLQNTEAKQAEELQRLLALCQE